MKPTESASSAQVLDDPVPSPRIYIKVNERLQTTAPGVWAIGEVAGSPKFTHISIDDFRVVRDNLTGGNHITTGRQVPFCLFTDPEFARVGLSEKEAKAQGIAYPRFKIPSAASAHKVVETGRAQISAA
jgi:pyruvate/2-oxoglutarate dehydrogenase complex dihydrolipoamide dehydrogenase (E3) component